jgi:predicted nucleic acid-binding Zn ribbon protein
MKHCPQCDFIYEDDQSVCDMDGKELVSDPATLVTEQGFATPVIATPVPVSDVLPLDSAGRRWRNFALLTVFVLATLVIAFYLARANQLRSRSAPDVSESSTGRSAGDIPPQSTSGDTYVQPSSSDLVATQTPSADTASPEQSREQSDESSSAETDPSTDSSSASSSQSSTSKESLAHTRLTPGPVMAGAPSGNSRGPVIVRLNNGAAIRADEAWEKREGVWYRQGGVVTFLKRSEVRTIERLPSSSSRSKSAANNAGEKSRQTEPAPETKKESKVTSFLKKTGRILKKPFKF